MSDRRSGFTLIELLVVIAIIAILAAILFPVFQKAKEKSREATCNCNMKQIADAIQMYASDHNNFLADQTSAGIAYDSDGYWRDSLQWNFKFAQRYQSRADANGNIIDDSQPGGTVPGGMGKTFHPYLKSLAVFKCPSEWKDWPDGTGTVGHVAEYDLRSSYYFKFALMTYANMRESPVRASEVKYPTRAAMLIEQAWHSGKYRPFLFDAQYWQEQEDRPAFMRINCVFIDTHVGHIDVPYVGGGGHSSSDHQGYDAHWYQYEGANTTVPKPCFDLSKGARDIP